MLRNKSVQLSKLFFHGNKIWQQQKLQMCYQKNLQPVTLAYNVFESPQTEKQATPLIIMHGMLGSKQNWRGVGRALEPKLKSRIFTVDARNHGDSPHTEEHSSAHMAADIVEFMKQHGISKANVMGHSMGGRSMMYLALKYPHLVEKLIVVDISPISVPKTFVAFDAIFFAMQNIKIPVEVAPADGRKLAGEQIKDALGGDMDTVSFILQNLRKRDNGEFYWAPNLTTIHKNLRYFDKFVDETAKYPAFERPVLFICGTESKFVDPDHLPEIQKIFPKTELHWLDAGHLVHFDKPHEFIDRVYKFLTKN